jgi:hypothetical protein
LPDRQLRPQDDDHRHLAQQRHRHQVAERIVARRRHQQRAVDDGPRAAEQQRIAIRPGPDHRLGTDRPGRAAAVLHHHRLAELPADEAAVEPRRHVGIAAGGEGHHEAQRAVRVFRRPLRQQQRRRRQQDPAAHQDQ